MRFIEGIGYIDETTPYQQTNSATQTAGTTPFDNVLSAEAAKLNAAEAAPTTERSLDDIFREAADTYGISYDLLKAVAYTESGYNVNATSYCGAMGIMQLMPSTAQSLGVTDAYDPYQNIMGGAKLLSQLSNLYNGDTSLMLAAYNAGSGNVAKYGGIPPFKETQNYVAKILNLLGQGAPSASNVQATTAYQAATNNIYNPLNSTNTLYTKEELNTIFSQDKYRDFLSYYEIMMKIFEQTLDRSNNS